MYELRTERVLLRRWRAEDEREMTRINREPEVARYLNRPVDEAAIAGFYGVMRGHWEQYGFGPWALESLEPDRRGAFLGFAGLAFVPAFLSAAGSAPELGWRLDPAVWGRRGLATDASIAARDDALGRLEQSELISVIHPQNERSQRVAVKLGMRRERQIENPVLGIEVDVWYLRANISSSPSLGRPGAGHRHIYLNPLVGQPFQKLNRLIKRHGGAPDPRPHRPAGAKRPLRRVAQVVVAIGEDS